MASMPEIHHKTFNYPNTYSVMFVDALGKETNEVDFLAIML